MTIDIKTVILILGLSHLIQMLVLYHQYRVNPEINGPGWWLLWSGLAVLGFGLILLRSNPVLVSFVIPVQNVVILAGMIFIYVGALRFFDRPVPWTAIALGYGGFLALHMFFIFAKNDIYVRTLLMDGSIAVVSFVTAGCFLRNASGSIASTARFNASLFGFQGAVFVTRGVMMLLGTSGDHVDLFAPTLLNYLQYLDVLFLALLWTFGFIIMMNQKLHREVDETRQHFETIYNASPDGAIIIRVSDRQFIDCNDGFLHQSGYAKEDIRGRNALEMDLWADPDRGRQLIDILNATGACDNFEARFRRKDGTLMTGLTTVRSVMLHDQPHIISVTRDITDRKQAEAEREVLITELQGALDQVKTLKGIVPICANCKKIRDDKGFWEAVEAYVARHTEAKFTHGICPECKEKLYPESLLDRKKGPGK